MSEIDMSRPGSELFPETDLQEYNSYLDVNADPVVEDPLNTGVQASDAADHLSDKEMNFRALREEAAKLKEEREYWRGQAEAAKQYPVQMQQPQASQEDAFSALDWNDGQDVQKAFNQLKQQNEALRTELRDTVSSVSAKAQHSDWDKMVTEHVPTLTSKNPIFAEMIRNASNPYEAAYLLAEMNARANTSPPNSMSSNGQRAIANAQKPQTLASVGGGGTLSSADYYASMSDKDFMALASKHMANI